MSSLKIRVGSRPTSKKNRKIQKMEALKGYRVAKKRQLELIALKEQLDKIAESE